MSRHWNKSGKEYRKFGVSVGIVFIILAAISFWRGGTTGAEILGVIGGLLLLAGLILPELLTVPYFLWMSMADGLMWFNTRLILIIVFYLVLTPIGLLMRAFGKRPLDLKIEPGRKSYWKPREKQKFDPARCEKHY